MCRYGNRSYPTKFVCFSCRRCTQKPSMADWLDQRPTIRDQLHHLNPFRPGRSSADASAYEQLRDRAQKTYQEELGRCATCGGTMHNLGHDFRPPPRRDERSWRVIERTHSVGHRFHSCGCDGPGFIPSTPREYRTYLAGHLADYKERLAEAQRSSAADRLDHVAYWTERVTRVEAAMAQI